MVFEPLRKNFIIYFPHIFVKIIISLSITQASLALLSFITKFALLHSKNRSTDDTDSYIELTLNQGFLRIEYTMNEYFNYKTTNY
ncbi:MAG: hypothetical protein IJY67_08935 [Paludibacteraceae bacterium]|nr:hypothetical protein [Paludibacteraceae bacterium]